jgi:hypothetical protein
MSRPSSPASPRSSNLLLWAALLVILSSFAIDLHLTRKYGGADLLDKVIGSRSLLEGRSPYFEPWRPGDPERFADPLVPQGSALTRFTGSPFQALIMAPMTIVPFPAMRVAWLFMQYALLLLSIGLLLRAYGTEHRWSGLVALAVLAVMLTSVAWRLHVERGQIYVIFTTLIAGLFLAARRSHTDVLGALGAMLILFKPTFGLLLLPLLFKLDKRMLIGGLAMLVVALVPFLALPDGFSSWAEYSEAMKIWGANPGEGAIPPETPENFQYPASIEGATNLADHHPMEAENGSIAAILYAFGVLVPPWLPYALILGTIAVIVITSWSSLRQARTADLLLIGFCLNTMFMMMLPVLRFHYQFVLWTAPVLYVLLSYRRAGLAWYLIAGFAGLLVAGGLDLLPFNVLIAELLLLGLIAIHLYHRLHKAGTHGLREASVMAQAQAHP